MENRKTIKVEVVEVESMNWDAICRAIYEVHNSLKAEHLSQSA